jgi:response regulator of citrate/malate metabolism
MQVLMIEDNENDYLLFSRYVTQIGDVQMQRCATVASGLPYLEAHPVDLLLLDMVLSDGQGLSVLDQSTRPTSITCSI